jgi:hypothetical protein
VIRLTCFHEVEELDQSYGIYTKDLDREGNKAIGYRSVCKECKEMYNRNNLSFVTEDEAYDWLLDVDT